LSLHGGGAVDWASDEYCTPKFCDDASG
jgi:hypothetical protein